MTRAIVVAAVRTPFAPLDGALAGVDADGLAAAVVRAAVERAGVDPGAVADVILATATAPGGNLARRAALAAGLPPGVPGLTLDRQCGGGLDAVALACRLVEAGAGEAYVAGGTESASTSPMRAAAATDEGARGRRFFPRAAFAAGGWEDPGMAESAELVAAERGIGRARQDAYAARSHARAAAAVASGAFAAELVAVGGVAADACPRPRLDAPRCARFPPVVRPGGTVTAANSSQIADGAAAVVVMSHAAAREAGVGAGLVHADSAVAGVDPRVCGLGAVPAVRALAARDPGFDPGRVDAVAFTEAFAAQVLATVDDLGLDEGRVNPLGGAIALGHPWGASGAAQVVRAFHDVRGRDGATALTAAAVAGGMGVAARWRWGAP